MKRTTRLLALLMSLLVVIGLLPAAASQAAYTPYDTFIAETAPTINGAATEGIWMIDYPLSDRSAENAPTAYAGFLWDADNLYVAIRHNGAETVAVTVGEDTAVYRPADDSFSTNTLQANAAAQGSVVELAIPFDSINATVDHFGAALPIALVVSNANGSAAMPEDAALRLKGEVMFMADDCGDKSAKGYVKGAQYNDGSNLATEVTITQEESAYRFYAPAKKIITNGIRLSRTIPNDPMTIEFEVTLNKLSVYSGAYPWRGFVFDLRTDHYLRRCSINKGSDGIVYFNMLIAAGKDDGVRAATSLKEGDRAVIRLEVLEDQATELHINNEYVYTFPAQEYRATSSMDPRQILEWSICQYNWVSGETDVTLHGYQITRPVYTDDAAVAAAMLDSLTFDDFKGGNSSPEMVLADLDLPDALEVPMLGSSSPLTWESSAPAIIAHDGSFVSEGEGGEVILTATLTYNGVEYTKSFTLNVPAFDPNATAMYLEDDKDPYTGALTSKGMSLEVTLDQKLTSVGYDMGGVVQVNSIILTDDDGLSRIHKENISLYVSDDNETYRRVKDWTLFRSGEQLILANFDEECRYVKVHCHLEDTDGAAFTNNLQAMIVPEYNDDLLGANGGEFTLLRKVEVSAEAGYTDAIAKIQQESEYDLRFVSDGKLLQHYYDGESWFVRVPEIEDTAIVEIWGGNELASDLSDLEGVFEAVYGNRTAQDMTDSSYYGNIKVRQMPNGDLIAIFNRPANPCDLMYRRSTDGGRTWSDAEVLTDTLDRGRNEGGSYLRDGDRVWFCYFFYTRFSQNNMANSDCKIALIYTDDNGYTWSEPYYVNTGHTYSLTYSNGIKLSGFDGEGENVDYLFPYHFQSSNSGSFQVSAYYSKDGGKTWVSSESCIDYEGPSGFEGGPTEAAVAELADGTIKMLMRCQYSSVYWLCTTYSEDCGVTWNEQAVKTNISAPNTMPVLDRLDVDGDGDQDYVLEWGGNNLLGASSYKRYPLTLAWSDDEMQTWKQKLSIYAGTSYATYTGKTHSTTQPDITFSNYMGSDDAYVCWSDWSHNEDTMGGILIEDFTDYLYKTKGAGDTFEGTSLRHDGWLPVTGDAAIAAEDNGNHYMKITDASGGIVRVDRTMPALFAGEISMDIKAESFKRDSNYLLIELKSAFSDSHYPGTLINLLVYPDGTVKDRDLTVTPGSHDTTLGTINIAQWNRFTFRFDTETGAAELYVNGTKLGNLTMDLSRGESITNFHISDASSTKNQVTIDVDNFVATDGKLLTVTDAPEEPEVPETFDIAGTTMTLGNDLALNFMVETADVTGEDWYAEIVHGEKTAVIEQDDWVASGDYYRIAYKGIAAKEMVDEVTITIYDADGNELAAKKDSVRAYAMRLFGTSGDAFDTVLADMLNYGTEAQLLLNYKTNDLANSLMTEEQAAKATKSVTMTDIRETSAGYQGATLELENNILLNFYYSTSFVGQTATIRYTDHYGTVHSYDVIVEASGSYGKVSVDKLVISDCSVKVTVIIDDLSVTDSVESYCARMQNDLALGEPLMKFATSARAYFNK